MVNQDVTGSTKSVMEIGEKMEDKNRKLLEGLSEHYSEVGKIALKHRTETLNIPIVGMGHLFAVGGITSDGDGVRELYIGGAIQVDEKSFPDYFDYMALGHLHTAQLVGTSEHIRYSGSPIPMGFSESGLGKKVAVIEFDGQVPQISEYSVPCFQQLCRISGGSEEIISKIEELKSAGSNAWLEVEITGDQFINALSDQLNEIVVNSDIRILRIRNNTLVHQTMSRMHEDETLDDLDPDEVFNRCLDANQIEEPIRTELILAYKEITNTLVEQDINAE